LVVAFACDLIWLYSVLLISPLSKSCSLPIAPAQPIPAKFDFARNAAGAFHHVVTVSAMNRVNPDATS
jgi:hypothetical protein